MGPRSDGARPQTPDDGRHVNISEQPTARFEVRMTSDSHFGWIRTRLALERTLMASVRTSVSLIGFGFTIVQFFQRLNDTNGVLPARRPEAPRYLGLALIGSGILVMIISSWQFRGVVRYLWSEPFRALAGKQATGDMRPVLTQTPGLAVSLLVTLIGVFAFAAVLLRFV
jgi:putative membrane protein